VVVEATAVLMADLMVWAWPRPVEGLGHQLVNWSPLSLSTAEVVVDTCVTPHGLLGPHDLSSLANYAPVTTHPVATTNTPPLLNVEVLVGSTSLWAYAGLDDFLVQSLSPLPTSARREPSPL